MIRSTLRNRLPHTIKQPVKTGLRAYARATARYRMLPGFLVVGAQKSGTSSLFYYLQQHPSVAFAPVITKEVHFFDQNFAEGTRWYRSHFPLRLLANCRRAVARPTVTGEASPEYMFLPYVPQRVHDLLPQAKLIFLLRNPVDRAYSQYQMNVRRGVETREFEDALDSELRRSASEPRQVLNSDSRMGVEHIELSYQARGRYVEQLRLWHAYFSREQTLIVRSEDLFSDTRMVYQRTLAFLGLRPFEPRDLRNIAPGGYRELQSPYRERLVEYFKPYNRELYQYLQCEPLWPSG